MPKIKGENFEREREKGENIISKLSRDIARAGHILNAAQSNDSAISPSRNIARALSSQNEFAERISDSDTYDCYPRLYFFVGRNSKEEGGGIMSGMTRARDDVFSGVRTKKMKRVKATARSATRDEHSREVRTSIVGF